MLTAILSILFFVWFGAVDCASAFTHKHDRLKDAEVNVSSWNGCSIAGTINGVSTPLFMDVASCPLHAKVPGRFRVRYDQSCGAVLEITDGPAITTPMPPNCPIQTPTPTPTPTAGQVTISGKTFSVFGGAFPFVTVTVWKDGQKFREMQEQNDGAYFFTIPPGSYKITVNGGENNPSPGEIYLTNITASTGGLTTLNFTFGPKEWFKVGPPMCIPNSPCPPGAQPSPTPTPTPSPTPAPSPTPTPSPTPSPQIESRELSADRVTRTNEINEIVRTTGLRFIGCSGNVCYFERRP